MYYFVVKQTKKIEKQYIEEKNVAVGSLSLKYKKNLEQMYDEHIFAITHELRSPLAVINASSVAQLDDLRMIYNEYYDAGNIDFVNLHRFKEMKERIRVVDQQVRIIESFIANLAEYGSYVSARSNDEFKIIDIHPYLVSMINNAPTFSRSMKIFNGDIKFGDGEGKDFDMIHLPVNANDLSRILINVFKNAADAVFNSYAKLQGRDTSFKPCLNIRCVKTNDKDKSLILNSNIIGPFGKKRAASPFYIVIEDNGPGISEENKDKIFSYGFSTKSQKENLGMGLHISMQLAEQNDLALFFDTNTEGTRFIIGFPHVLFFECSKREPNLGWISSPEEVYISEDSEELFHEIVAEVVPL